MHGVLAYTCLLFFGFLVPGFTAVRVLGAGCHLSTSSLGSERLTASIVVAAAATGCGTWRGELVGSLVDAAAAAVAVQLVPTAAGSQATDGTADSPSCTPFHSCCLRTHRVFSCPKLTLCRELQSPLQRGIKACAMHADVWLPLLWLPWRLTAGSNDDILQATDETLLE